MPIRKKKPGIFKRARVAIKKRFFEAAQDNRHNEKHWTNATSKDADAEISTALPRLRERARYEIRNNSYARGILDTLANDIVGNGPQLNLMTDNERFNEETEKAWKVWIESPDLGGRLNLAEMLRLAVFQLVESGEMLAVKSSDKKARGVQFRILMIEPDRLCNPGLSMGSISSDPNMRDGIKTDEFGKPVSYNIQKNHPGTDKYQPTIGDWDTVPADMVYHLYRQDRPGQTRGVPWITPALGLFAQLRRYTQAVLQAAETAADLSAVMESTSSDLSPVDVDELDEIEFERNTMLTLPAGWKMSQFKPEQPASSYKEFKGEIINEIARCLCMPSNIAMANSAGYNYSSGRLDWQVYYRMIRQVQSWICRRLLIPLFMDWLIEARRLRGLIPMTVFQDGQQIEMEWYWQGAEHVDPQKEANAEKTRLESNTTTLAEVYARQGKDWKKQLEQRAKEKKLIEELMPAPVVEPPKDQDQETDKDQGEDDNDDEKENKGAA